MIYIQFSNAVTQGVEPSAMDKIIIKAVIAQHYSMLFHMSALAHSANNKDKMRPEVDEQIYHQVVAWAKKQFPEEWFTLEHDGEGQSGSSVIRALGDPLQR